MRRVLAIPLLVLPVVAFAQDVPVPALDHLFPKEVDVYTTTSALSRLELPPEILAQVKADLSDVRLFDAHGEEVPWFVDTGLRRGETFRIASAAAAKPRNVSRERIGDGKNVPAVSRERYEITLPAAAPEGENWTLAFRTSKQDFVRAVRIDALDAQGRPTPWVEEQSIFRLGPGRERLRVVLPAGRADAIVVTLEGQDDAWLEPEMAFESSRDVGVRSEVRVPLSIVSRESERGKTTLEVSRPSGLVPDELEFETSTPSFDRNVDVWDEGVSAGESMLGSRAIYRVQAVAVAEDRVVPIGSARGDRLRIVVADGDSPVLKDLAVSAIIRRPALIFSLAPQNGGGAAGVLRFGGGRAWRPAYDLGGFGATEAYGARARIASMVYDAPTLPVAKLGTVRPNPSFDARPSLSFAMRPGADVDVRAWHDRRSVTLTPSPDGLSRLRLSPADTAGARADLADVRFVDGQARQWPYLLERDSRRDWVDAPVAAERKDRQSNFALTLPATPAVVDEIAVSIESPFFDRGFRLAGVQELDRRELRDEATREVTLASGRLSRRAGDPRPVHVSFPPTRLRSLTLIVDDGDDAALPVKSAKVRVPTPELFIVAPAGSYSLLLGNPEEHAPRYEIARVRDVVLAMESGTADAGPLEANPGFSRAARLAQSGTRDTVVLWGVIILAVLGLGGLTLKLARTPGKPGNPKPDGGGTPA